MKKQVFVFVFFALLSIGFSKVFMNKDVKSFNEGELISRTTRVKRQVPTNYQSAFPTIDLSALPTRKPPSVEDADCFVEIETIEIHRVPGTCHSFGPRQFSMKTCMSEDYIAFSQSC